MAAEPEGEELLLDREQDEGGDAGGQGQEGQGQGSNEAGEQADEELEIAFGDEAAPASGERDTNLVKHLREEIRKRDKALAERGSAAPQAIEVGPKPSLETCEFDQDKFEAEYEAWRGRKAQAEALQSNVQQQNRAVEEAWQADVRRFEARKAELKVPDANEAIETAMASLNQVQQAVIVKAADNPALVFAALGKHPGKLAEIASILDPLKQAAAVAKLEGTLKVTPRRQAPPPEEIASGSASVTPKGQDKVLERLEKEAERSGDYSKVFAHQRAQRNAQAK